MKTRIKSGVKMRTKASAFAVLLLIGLGLAHSISTDSANSTQKKPTFDDAAKEEATPFTAMSQHQQEHARLYGSYSGVGKRLTDLARERGEDVTVGVDPPLQMTQPEGDFQENALESLARRVDAIVVASVKDKTSMFNEGETFVFTEHKVRVEEVIRNNSSAPIDPGAEITIMRAGGKVLVDGRTVLAIESSVKPIRVGTTYLLFLKWVPTTGAYQSISPFEVKGNKLIALNTLLHDFQGERDATAILDTVRKVAFR
jgi:hypothetical protein